MNTESSGVTLKYIELIAKIEQLTELFYLALPRVTVPVSFSPAFLVAVINYFVYDLGENSFYLLAPVKYECHKKQIFVATVEIPSYFLGCPSIGNVPLAT